MPANLIRAIPDVFTCRPKSEFSLDKHLSNFESLEDANKRRDSLVKALRRYHPEQESLINSLETCSKTNRCRLLACPRCMRVLRMWFCDQVAPLVDAEPGMFKRITLVPERHRHGLGTLHTFKAQHLIDDLRTAVKKLGLKNIIIFGSIDYCEEVICDQAGRYRQLWCPHLELMSNIPSDVWQTLKVELRRYYPVSKDIRKPIHMVEIHSRGIGILKPISYCIKSSFPTNYTSPASNSKSDGPSGLDKKPAGKRKPQRMHGRMSAELACLHSNQGFKDRIVLIGLKHIQKSIVRTAKFGDSQKSLMK